MPYLRISPHFPPVFPRFSPFSPVFPHFPPFFPIFPHFSHFSHFSVAQKRLGDSGVGDFQGLFGDSRVSVLRISECISGILKLIRVIFILILMLIIATTTTTIRVPFRV